MEELHFSIPRKKSSSDTEQWEEKYVTIKMIVCEWLWSSAPCQPHKAFHSHILAHCENELGKFGSLTVGEVN